MIEDLNYITIMEHIKSGKYLVIRKDQVKTLELLCKFANIKMPEYKIVKYQVVFPRLSGLNGNQYLVRKNGNLFAAGLTYRIHVRDTYFDLEDIPKEYRRFARPVKF